MDIEETALPGIGLRHDFLTGAGRRVGVVSHRRGRRELVVYSERDPDAAEVVIVLAAEESDALAELLGVPRIIQRLTRLQEQAAGLVTEAVHVAPGSPYDGRTIIIAGLALAAGAATDLAPLAAGYVLILAVLGPIVARAADPLARRLLPLPEP